MSPAFLVRMAPSCSASKYIMDAPTSILSTLLFETIQPPKRGTGRVVRFGDGDIDLEIATGPMAERVLALLEKVGEPMTTSEIARGTGSNSSQVSTALKRLISSGVVASISVEGCYREYKLKA